MAGPHPCAGFAPGGSDPGPRRRAAERQGTFPATFAEDERDVQVEIEVGDPQAGDLAAAGAGVQTVPSERFLARRCRSKEWLRLKGPMPSMAGP
jgi:hypothetical protein